MTDDVHFSVTQKILDRLYEAFDGGTRGFEIAPKLLDDAANEIEWLRSVVAAMLNGPLSGDSAERRTRFPDEQWKEVHDALDEYERTHNER